MRDLLAVYSTGFLVLAMCSRPVLPICEMRHIVMLCSSNGQQNPSKAMRPYEYVLVLHPLWENKGDCNRTICRLSNYNYSVPPRHCCMQCGKPHDQVWDFNVAHWLKTTLNLCTLVFVLLCVLHRELEEELDRLESTGCNEPSNGSYASNLILVSKKDGGLRVCVDYRGVSKDTVPDRYPIRRIDELIDTIGCRKGKFFSSLDLMKAYHQVKLTEQSKQKTAFSCHKGLFHYRSMPFGLTNASATFERLMNVLFSGIDCEFVFMYLDDILIASKPFDERLIPLGRVLERLQEAGL